MTRYVGAHRNPTPLEVAVADYGATVERLGTFRIAVADYGAAADRLGAHSQSYIDARAAVGESGTPSQRATLRAQRESLKRELADVITRRDKVLELQQELVSERDAVVELFGL